LGPDAAGEHPVASDAKGERAMSDRRQALGARLDELSAGFSGDFALYVRKLETGETIERRADETFPTASTIKVFILLELMRRVHRGDFRLDEHISIRTEQLVGGSGVLKELSGGLSMTLRDVATLMIVLSDNTATNVLIDLLGLDAINDTIKGFGLATTRLVNRVDFDRIGGDVNKFAVTTAREFGRALEQVASGTFLDRASCDIVIDIMQRQQYLDLLPRYLPYNPYARDLKLHQDLCIANKTGFFLGVRCDTAIIFAPGTTLIAIALSKNGKDLGFQPENENAVLLGNVGRALYDYFCVA
jgi:beta-lactamase class A